MTIADTLREHPWMILLGSIAVAASVLIFVFVAVLAAIGGGAL